MSTQPIRRWTDSAVQNALQPFVDELGRMPTAPELRRAGRNDLACAISKRSGFAFWAGRMGLALHGEATHRGREVEARIADWLRERGFDVVHQTALAPFDLLVNGCVRIDVKSATYSEYLERGVRGHIFGNLHPDPQCDLYILCGVNARNEILWRYFVPSERARIQTLTITPTGRTYAPFREAVHVLERMCARASPAPRVSPPVPSARIPPAGPRASGRPGPVQHP